MSMSAIEVAGILAQHVVRTSFLGARTFTGATDLFLFTTDFTATHPNGAPCNVYQLKPEGPGAKAFPTPIKSYILNYKENSIQRLYLGADANLCFTVTMNSCTFGIGAPSAKGVLVTHANSRTTMLGQSTALNQEQRQAQMVNVVHGPGATMVAPGAYHRDDYGNGIKQHMTTVGVRFMGAWQFHLHKHLVNNTAKQCTWLSWEKVALNNVV